MSDRSEGSEGDSGRRVAAPDGTNYQIVTQVDRTYAFPAFHGPDPGERLNLRTIVQFIGRGLRTLGHSAEVVETEYVVYVLGKTSHGERERPMKVLHLPDEARAEAAAEDLTARIKTGKFTPDQPER